MSNKVKNIKIFIISLSICLTSSFYCNTQAMEFKIIETPKEEKEIIIKTTNKKFMKKISLYKKTIKNYLNIIEKECQPELGIKHIQKTFEEYSKIIKKQIECSKNNKINTEKFIKQLQNFGILEKEENKNYVITEEIEKDLINFINNLKEFLEEKEEELDFYLTEKNNNQFEIPKKIIDIYEKKIEQIEEEIIEKNIEKDLVNLVDISEVEFDNKLDYKKFIKILNDLKITDNIKPECYYLSPETKEHLTKILNDTKIFINRLQKTPVLKTYILYYIKAMNERLYIFLNKCMKCIQNKKLDTSLLEKYKDEVKNFFCFDQDSLNQDIFFENLFYKTEYKNIISNDDIANHCMSHIIFIFPTEEKTLLKNNIDIVKKVLEKTEEDVKNVFKNIKNQNANNTYKNIKLIENKINTHLELIISKIISHENDLNSLLEYYKENGTIDENLENVINKTKKDISDNIFLTDDNKLDKEKLTNKLKFMIKKSNNENYENINYNIPPYYEKKSEDYFNKYKKKLNFLYEEFQKNHEKIKNEAKIYEKNNNYKKNTTNKNIPAYAITNFLNNLEQKIGYNKNAASLFFNCLKQNNSPETEENLNDKINFMKNIAYSGLCLTKEQKINKKKFFDILKKSNIIDNINYKIDFNSERALTCKLINFKEE